jgi:hypothetical protein
MATNKTAFRTMVVFLIAGIAKRFTNTTQVAFGGATYTPAQLTQLFQSLVDLYDSVTAAKATYEAKLQAAAAQEIPLVEIVKGFRAYLLLNYGKQPDVLSDFGQKPRKTPSTLTTAEKVAAVELRKATRAIRHTTGAKAKLKIKAQVAEPAPSGTPAPGASVTSGPPSPTK